MTEHATVSKITRHNGVAGQVGYSATVGTDTVTFVSNMYGGPIVMVTQSGTQVIVRDPERFGTFGPAWVRRFFAF